MATKDLITIDRARLNISAITDSSKDGLLQALITSYSDYIQKYCKRDFISRAYDELYNGNGESKLILREYPLQSVQSVRYRPVVVLKITNTTTSNIQARVSITSTGLSLFRSNAGTSYTDTSLLFATYPTLTALKNAIIALSNGWTAQVTGDATNYGSWPSSDLYWPTSFGDGLQSQGALQCVAGSFAELQMHTYELSGYQWNARGWLLRAIPYTDPELSHPEDLVFPSGINNFRVQYTAGYSTIPEAVQQACAELVALSYFETQRDAQISNSVGASTGTGYTDLFAKGLPGKVKLLLDPYKRTTISSGQG